MKKTPKAKQNNADKRRAFADDEYNRLVSAYKAAGVDDIKLEINDSLLRKTAELYGVLEAIKDLPTVLFNPIKPDVTEETAAGKVRVKYMAQFTSSMTKLNKELLGVLGEADDDSMSDFEGDE